MRVATCLLVAVATAVSKYWICKSATWTVGEALECLGGNGYVEESKMPRLYREAPLNSIWEGSGNVNSLDVLRAMFKSPGAVEAFRNEIGAAAGAEPRLDRFSATIVDELSDTEGLEYRARRLPAAFRQAHASGRAGARFPWESARSGRDVTPDRSRVAGETLPILTGQLEEHIVSDVAWGVACYLDWTGDREFADGPGRTILVETARYWASRIRLDGADVDGGAIEAREAALVDKR